MAQFIYFILQYYGVSLLATVIFLLFACINSSLHKSIIKYFRAATASILVLIIADSVQAYCALLPEPTIFRTFAAAMGYILRVATIYFVLMIYKRNSVSERVLYAIPLFCTILVSILAFFTTLSFYYTETNEIVRGPLIIVPFLASIFYFFALIYETFAEVHMVDHRESLLVCIIFIIVMIATIMEIEWGFLSALPGVSIIGLAAYYIYFLSNKYTKDRLTEAFTRERLYLDTQKTDRPFGLIGFDVNDLKLINDREGHLAGDRALVTIANAVESCMNNRSRLYRVGGDEFVVVYFTNSFEEVKNMEQAIRDAISKTSFRVAAGSAFRQENQSIESVLSAADQAMYENKRNQKARQNLLKK